MLPSHLCIGRNLPWPTCCIRRKEYIAELDSKCLEPSFHHARRKPPSGAIGTLWEAGAAELRSSHSVPFGRPSRSVNAAGVRCSCGGSGFVCYVLMVCSGSFADFQIDHSRFSFLSMSFCPVWWHGFQKEFQRVYPFDPDFVDHAVNCRCKMWCLNGYSAAPGRCCHRRALKHPALDPLKAQASPYISQRQRRQERGAQGWIGAACLSATLVSALLCYFVMSSSRLTIAGPRARTLQGVQTDFSWKCPFVSAQEKKTI